ncbi:MAG: hypothetical protein ABJ360_28740 [Roseobacter sp.]
MPHAELKYSQELQIEPLVILQFIEETIHGHDTTAGECKGRAYPCEFTHHKHLYLSLSMLKKPHRDDAYTSALMAKIEKGVKGKIPESCFFSFSLEYSTNADVTNWHEVGE